MSDHNESLRRAAAANDKLRATRKDRWYPTFHIAAPAGWINDPNGLSHFNGRYQVFFQHHPSSPEWGPMHWGHVSSSDLIHFRREPIALAPSLEADRDGVFSGSAVTGPDGELEVFYTGHRWRNGVNEDDGNLQVQCRATSRDGVHFDKHGTVVEAPAELAHFRDPKVFRRGDDWLMVFGACSADNRGQVMLYRSSDLADWEFDRVLFEDPNPDVFMLECPDVFPLTTPDGREVWALLYCPMGLDPVGHDHRNDHTSGYVIGEWPEGGDFHPMTGFRDLDQGNEFYAPQTFAAPDGRRVLFGWMGSFTVPAAPQTGGDGWFGQLTVPREMSVTDDLRLEATPVAEVGQLRGETLFEAGEVNVGVNDSVELAADAGPCEIRLTVDRAAASAERLGLLVHATAPGRGTYIAVDEQAGRLVVDRRTTGPGDLGYRSAAVGGGPLELRVLVDRGSVEVFIRDGEGRRSSLTAYSVPADGPRTIALLAESGTGVFRDVSVTEMTSIWED